ncbi:hypothetical protein PISMIDRAFT_676899 [Pisolithus microcarpus 441]|uniref:G domain-containing protein n=1 Tax=Pisolithus microcarpus 441 TaxID=765257 RepID=A0A0C9ZI09_9AGAM|nr:hypothetical protein PISMIDRAFT_676899 [Pisolithus microcarpus 441]
MAPQPVIIALMGPTGSGKTSFINRLTGSKEDNAAHQLTSHTQTIRVSGWLFRQCVFVDTPGFDDTY